MKPIEIIFFTLFIFLALGANCAQSQDITDIEEAFKEARELAFEGEYSEAREITRKILDEVPDYHDVRILQARTYAWQQRFREARTELSTILEQEPDNAEALSARVDVEQWSGNYQVALQFADRAIDTDPENSTLHFKRAAILKELGHYSMALESLDEAETLGADPENILALRESIRDDGRRNMVVFGMSRDDYNVDLSSRERIYFEYHRLTDYGPVIARLNADHRFDVNGYQFELDAFPRISPKWYGYLNVGYSNSTLFPEWRAGVEAYRELPRSFEASAGLRYLKFAQDDVLIFTGSASKYWRNWFFSVRPFFTPQDSGVSTAVNLFARHYFGHPENFAQLSGGFGFSPDERRLLDGTFEERLTQSYYVGITGNRRVKSNVQLFGEFRWTLQELQGFPDFSHIYTLEAGVRYRF